MRIKLKRGRKGIPMSDELRARLYAIIQRDSYKSIEEIASEIGVSYKQLWNPLNGVTNCSPESHKKIVQYVGK